jgi:hypothetical protein
MLLNVLINDAYLFFKLCAFYPDQVVKLLALFRAEFGDLLQVCVLLLNIDEIDRVDVLSCILERNLRPVSHVEPSLVVSERTVFTRLRAVYRGKLVVVEVLLDEP